MTTPYTAGQGLGEIQAIEREHVLQTYRRQPVAFVRGEGVYLFDSEGRRHLDLVSGIGVASLGHAHAGLSRALAEQAATLAHTSNLYFHPLQGQVAAKLAALSGLPRAFLCNSGTEAVEACLKFARRYWFSHGQRQRTGFVAFDHGFSGRTLGALSVTWDEHYRTPFQPLVPGVTFVPVGDPDALVRAIGEQTAAVIAEPIQGEGGVRPLPAACVEALSEACARTGALLIADEVQSGLGRTGRAFHSHTLGLAPDLIAVGKALGGGFPVAAALLSEGVADAIQFGDHGSTYGGNLLACRAALVVLEALTDGGLMDGVARAGARLDMGLGEIGRRHASVREVRGRGLIWGLDLAFDAAPVVKAALDRGLLVNRTSETVVRLLPPYIIDDTQIDEGLALLDAAIGQAAGDRI